jgi:predicted RNA binding protein YcfA (HicA-like mRNA interferase family)
VTKKDKDLKRIKNNRKDVQFVNLRKVLVAAGFKERQPKGGSSHYIYYHESLDRIVTLTKGSKRLPEYQVKDALRALQRQEVSYEKG